MTHLKLKEQFAQRGRTRDVDRVSSGSPVDLVLRPADTLAAVRTIDATLALVRRGLTMLKAKRVIEAMIEHGSTTVQVPLVEDIAAIANDLRAAGVEVATLAKGSVDVRAIRESLKMTQEQFALRFNLDLDTVRNWEQGRYAPDRAGANFLRVIASKPDEAAAAQEQSVR